MRAADAAVQMLSAAKKKEEARQRIEDAKKAKLAAQAGEGVEDEEAVAEMLKPSKKSSASGKSPRAPRVDVGACCTRASRSRSDRCAVVAEAAIKGVDLDALLANPAPGESKKARAKKAAAAAAAEGGDEADAKPKSSSSRRRVGKDEGELMF